MKKVYCLLILLSVFSLLDGTPIHNCHGKFISTRQRSSQFELFDKPVSSRAIDQNDITDDTNDSEHLIVFPSDATADRRPLHENYSIVTKADTEWLVMPVPLYKLVCDFRI